MPVTENLASCRQDVFLNELRNQIGCMQISILFLTKKKPESSEWRTYFAPKFGNCTTTICKKGQTTTCCCVHHAG